MGSQLPRRFKHVGQIRVAVTTPGGRSPDGDENHLRFRHPGLELGGKDEPPGFQVLLNQIVEARFIDGDVTRWSR